jgi:outer membrane protein TolC
MPDRSRVQLPITVAILLGFAAPLALGFTAPLAAQDEARALTLAEAIDLAADGNPGLDAMRLRVEEMRQRNDVAFTNYLPRVETWVNYLVNDNRQGILIPGGSLGTFPGLGSFPPADTNIPQGGTDLFFAFTTVAQPLTHFFMIREGRGVARADVEIAEAELLTTQREVELGVLQAYAGLLIARRGVEVAGARVAAAEERIGYQTVAVSSGTAAEVAEREARVRWLEARQALLEKENEVDDLEYALADAIGLESGTTLRLEEPEVFQVEVAPLDTYLASAMRANAEVRGSQALVRKGEHGVGAARAAYIPEIGLLGAHVYQSSVPFFPKNTFGFGISGKWTILDFGARGNVVRERRAQLGQAEQSLDMIRSRVRGEVETAYRRLERARDMVELAREATSLRTEAARLRTLQADRGYGVPADALDARADQLEADLDSLRAELGYRIAWQELLKVSGTPAGR